MCIKVLIADDTAVMREAIRSLLGNEPEIELVGETEDFPQTLTMACKLKPQVVILDVHMPNVANLTPMNVSETSALTQLQCSQFRLQTMSTPKLWPKAMALSSSWIK